MYDKNAGLNICDECGAYVIDGYCDCDLEPDWYRMLEIARHDFEVGNYPRFGGTFLEFLAWKTFPGHIISEERNRKEKND